MLLAKMMILSFVAMAAHFMWSLYREQRQKLPNLIWKLAGKEDQNKL